MKCPCCGRELTVGQELLYRIEDVYYCPCCLVKITGWPRVEGTRDENAGSVEPKKAEFRKVDDLE